MKNIAVIGAGIVGICSAFFLQKSGYKVTIFDQNLPGSGTSYGHACTFADYACIPINSPHIYKNLPKMILRKDGPLYLDFSYVIKNFPWAIKFLKNCQNDKVEFIASSLKNLLNNARLEYDKIFEDVDISDYIKENDVMYLYLSEKDFIEDQYSLNLRKKNNVKFKILEKNEVRDIEPNIKPIYFKGILFEGSRHTTNPIKISEKIFNKFIEFGGIFHNRKITSIKKMENQMELQSENINYNFDKIIISAGAWSNKLSKMIGDDFPLETERGYHVLFENNKDLISRPIGCSSSGFYIIQIEEGIRAAGTVEIAGLEAQANGKRLKMIENQVKRLLPNLSTVKSTWLGYRPTLPDSMPVIGVSPKNENVLYAFGHQHIGWTTAAVTGKTIQYLVENRKPNYDISSFSPNRFF